jgi:hypothetical protein
LTEKRVIQFARNGFPNSRFLTLLFEINGLRSDELPHCWLKSHCSGAIAHLLCNQNFKGSHSDLRRSRALTMAPTQAPIVLAQRTTDDFLVVDTREQSLSQEWLKPRASDRTQTGLIPGTQRKTAIGGTIALARERGMSSEERLRFHQAESGPRMAALEKWFKKQFAERKVEPNSGLGKAILYIDSGFLTIQACSRLSSGVEPNPLSVAARLGWSATATAQQDAHAVRC